MDAFEAFELIQEVICTYTWDNINGLWGTYEHNEKYELNNFNQGLAYRFVFNIL